MPYRKPTPIEAYEGNMADARRLVSYARALENQRSNRRMRVELRRRLGGALEYPQRQHDDIDGIESSDLFVVLKPGSSLTRSDFEDRSPLLRQALVAACAAFETYLADKAMTRLSDVLKGDELPRRLRDIPLTVGRWRGIERYERRSWGIRSVIEEHIREHSSTAPSKVGEVLATVGVTNWAKRVDAYRKVAKEQTDKDLKLLTERRNRIAHAADRKGRGRSPIDVGEVERHLAVLDEVVRALEAIA